MEVQETKQDENKSIKTEVGDVKMDVQESKPDENKPKKIEVADEPAEKKKKLEDGVSKDSKSSDEKKPDRKRKFNDNKKNDSKNNAKPWSKNKSNGNDRPHPVESFLTEKDCGVTEYIGKHDGFSAIIKQRYSDFIVNEIDQNGEVVHLTEMALPSDEAEKEEESVKVDKPTDIITSDQWEELEKLAATKSGSPVQIEAPEDKEKRTKIHLAIKNTYNNLETRTVEKDDKKFIEAFWRTGRGRESVIDWPQSKRDCKYVKFTMYKENKDTMDIIGLMAKNLRLKENLFQYAGTKDKRAKTTQEITAHKIHPKKLITLNKILYNFGVGNFRYVKEPLKLGQLNGNHFTIVLRNVTEGKEKVDAALESLKADGFINYFGMQRFGTTSIPTYEIGKALLSSKWNEAIDLILKPRKDQEVKQKFQSVWGETKDPEATMRVTPHFCHIERTLLGGLIKQLTPIRALEQIHRNTRMFYVHSYQSYVWNRIVSKRLKMHGLKVVEGDLVMTSPCSSDESAEQATSDPVRVTVDNLKDYSIKDVVLPLPGHKIMYPDNEVADWYKEMLQEDELDINDLERKQKDYSLPGAYRNIVCHPTNMSWKHSAYDDFTLQLSLSDFDVLKRGEKLSESNTGKFKAVVLEMSLPTSTYATMALREVLRQDTTAQAQAKLNTS